LCILYLFSHFGYRLFLFIFFHHESLLTAVTLASIACVFMLVGGDLCGRYEGTKVMGLLMHQRVSGATTNWRVHPFRSLFENAIWLGVVWGIYFFVYDSWLLAMILGSIMGGCAIYVNHLMFPSPAESLTNIEPPQLATNTFAERDARAAARANGQCCDHVCTNASMSSSQQGETDDNTTSEPSSPKLAPISVGGASLAGAPPSPLLTMTPSFVGPNHHGHGHHHGHHGGHRSVRVLGPSLQMQAHHQAVAQQAAAAQAAAAVSSMMPQMGMQDFNSILLPHLINAAAAQHALHPSKHHYSRPLVPQSSMMMAQRHHSAGHSGGHHNMNGSNQSLPGYGTLQSFLAPSAIAQRPRHYHQHHHHGGYHGGRSRALSTHSPVFAAVAAQSSAPAAVPVPNHQMMKNVESKRPTLLSVIADANSNTASPEPTPTNITLNSLSAAVAEAVVSTPSITPPSDRSASTSPVPSSTSAEGEPVSPSPLAVDAVDGVSSSSSSAATSPNIVTPSLSSLQISPNTATNTNTMSVQMPSPPSAMLPPSAQWHQHQAAVAAMQAQQWAAWQQAAARVSSTWPQNTADEHAQAQAHAAQAQQYMYHQAMAAAAQRYIPTHYGNPAAMLHHGVMDATMVPPSPSHAAAAAAASAAAMAMYGATTPTTPTPQMGVTTVRRRTPRPAAPPGEGKGRRARRRRRFLASQAQLQAQQAAAVQGDGTSPITTVDANMNGDEVDDEEVDGDEEQVSNGSSSNDVGDTREASTSTSSVTSTSSSTDAPATPSPRSLSSSTTPSTLVSV
jgi:hypothetical protein